MLSTSRLVGAYDEVYKGQYLLIYLKNSLDGSYLIEDISSLK